MRQDRTFRPAPARPADRVTRGPGFRPAVEHLEDRAVPSTLYVDKTPTIAPKPPASVSASDIYPTIQKAVNAAAAGDTVVVEPDTYVESVVIKAAKDGLTLKSAGGNAAQTIIQSPDVSASTSSSDSVVRVAGATGVTINGFTVTGPSDGLDYGIQVDKNGSATVSNNVVTHIRSASAGLLGLQTGTGIEFGGVEPNGKYTGGSGVATGNTVTDYQKNGIEVDFAQSSVTVSNNVITGNGPTFPNGQNGVQVTYGANAVVTGNKITNNVYTDAPGATERYEASGVVIALAGTVRVSGNQLAGNEVGVAVVSQTSPVTISGNAITGRSLFVTPDQTLYGISLSGVTAATVTGNVITQVGGESYVTGDGTQVTGAGIELDGTTGSVVALNVVTGSGGNGIGVTAGSAYNLIYLNAFVGSAAFDIFDSTTGNGSHGTANSYALNLYVTADWPA